MIFRINPTAWVMFLLSTITIMITPQTMTRTTTTTTSSSLFVTAFYMHRMSHLEFAQTAAGRGIDKTVPVAVEEVLSLPQCERWLQHIVSQSRDELVLVRRGTGNQLLHAKMPLEEAIQEVMTKSSHQDPIRLSSGTSTSGIMAKDHRGKWREELPLQDIVDQLYVNEHTPPQEDILDWFPCFGSPLHLPLQDALVVAGEGSTSPVLQCHPFTKLHLCLDGSQLLRLLPPLHWQDCEAVRASAVPLAAEAWDGFPISLGYQTTLQDNLNLFAFRHWDVNHDHCQSKEFRQQVQQTRGRNIYDQFQHWAEDPTRLHPNFAVGSAPTYTTPTKEDHDSATPQQPRLHHDLWHSTVAMTGDLVVIPPGWWYQTYNLEPSVTIQSQRCTGTAMASQFISHIIEESGMDRMLRLAKKKNGHFHYTKEEAQSIVDTLMELLEEHYDEEEQGVPANNQRQRNGTDYSDRSLDFNNFLGHDS